MMDYIGVKEVAASAREEGKIEGKIEGVMEEKTSTVIEMDKEGFTLAQISKVAKLPEKKVKQIILAQRKNPS